MDQRAGRHDDLIEATRQTIEAVLARRLAAIEEMYRARLELIEARVEFSVAEMVALRLESALRRIMEERKA